jgi:hypothetical protein
MAKKIEIKGNFFIATDTVSGVVISRLPTKNITWDIYNGLLHIVYINRYDQNYNLVVADIVDGDGDIFTDQDALEDFLSLKLGGQVVIDAVIQSSTSPLLILKASELLLETTLTLQSVEDEYEFTVASVVGASIGNQLTIYSVTNNRVSTFTVLNIVGSLITVDSPIDYAYRIGDFAQFGNTNLAVDGSITPVVFGVRNPTAKDIELSVDFTRMILSMQTTTLGNLNLFGNIPKLTKGLVCRFVDGRRQNIFNVKDNREFDNLMFDFKFIPSQGGTPDGLSGRFTFDKLGSVIRLKPFEDLQFIVQDDLTDGTPNISIFEIILEGAGVTD